MHDHHRLDGVRLVRRPAWPRSRRGSAPWRQSPGMKSTSMPQRAAICRHSVAKWPVSTISTLSPGDSVLTIAASQAPVPEDGKHDHRALGLEDLLAAFEHGLAEFGELGAAMVDDRHVHGAEHAIRAPGSGREFAGNGVPGAGSWRSSSILSATHIAFNLFGYQPINCVQILYRLRSLAYVCSQP